MIKKFKTFDPQLVFAEQIAGSAIALTNEAKLSLYKKSQKSGIPTNVLETVYYRGYSIWNESFGQTPEQFAFDRVNSFIAGGFAADLDDDLCEAFITPHRKIIHHDTWGYAVGTKKNKAHVFTSEASAEKHAKDLKKRSPHLSLTPVRKHPTSTDPDLSKMHIIAASNVRRTDLAEDYIEEDVINEGEVIKTKFAVKNMQKRGIEGPHPVVGDDLMRNWALHKMPKKTHDMPDISYHRGTARFHDMKKGTHFDVKGGSPRTTVMNTHPKPGDTKDPIGLIAPKTPVSFKQDKVKKKKGNVVPIKETQIDEKRGLWDNIHAKRERIKHGSGEHMRKPGSKGAPTAADLKNSQNEELINELSPELIGKVNKARTIDGKPSKTEAASKTLNIAVKNAWAKTNVGTVKEEYTGSDSKSNDPNNLLARMDGTYQGAKVYADKTPGQKLAHTTKSTLKTIKKVVKEEAASDSDKLSKFRKDLADNKAKIEIDMAEKGEKHPATQQPADFLSRKRHAEKYTPDGIEKPVKAGDGFGSVQQHLRGTLQQQVQSNQGGKFNIQKNK